MVHLADLGHAGPPILQRSAGSSGGSPQPPAPNLPGRGTRPSSETPASPRIRWSARWPNLLRLMPNLEAYGVIALHLKWMSTVNRHHRIGAKPTSGFLGFSASESRMVHPCWMKVHNAVKEIFRWLPCTMAFLGSTEDVFARKR